MKTDPKDSYLDKICFCGLPSARTKSDGYLGLCREHALNSHALITDDVTGGRPPRLIDDG